MAYQILVWNFIDLKLDLEERRETYLSRLWNGLKEPCANLEKIVCSPGLEMLAQIS